MTHIYAFGSIIRGEVDQYSDTDLLVIANKYAPDFSPEKFSIYSEKRLRELWISGNPFAWHLHLESKLLFSSDGKDTILELGVPKSYIDGFQDCSKFKQLFEDAATNLQNHTNSSCFELSSIFLSIRNFATCFALYIHKKAVFSRQSALLLQEYSAPISAKAFDICLRARVLSTRGKGNTISQSELKCVTKELPQIRTWMTKLMAELI